MKIRSRPEKLMLARLIRGAVSLIIHDMAESSARRITSASDSPSTRARSRKDGGNFSTRIAMKTRLSIPKTTSRTISVNSPTQAAGSSIHSIFLRAQGGFTL